jgi:hypothetical protein
MICGESFVNPSFSSHGNLTTAPESDMWLDVFSALFWIHKSVNRSDFNWLVLREELLK